jgi:NTP pyrophosphatase (non-canonical NTP hydrolase)
MISAETRSAVLYQTDTRPNWKAYDTPQIIQAMIVAEGEELNKAIQEAMIGQSAFDLAAEIGDVFYLYTKYVSLTDKPLGVKATRCVLTAFKTAEIVGIDLDEAVQLKVCRNSLKYPNCFSTEAYDYREGIRMSRELWLGMGSDYTFSHAYLEVCK